MEQINLCPWYAALRTNRLHKCAQCAIATAILLALVACYVSYSAYRHMHHWRMDIAIYQQRTQRLQQQKTQLLMWRSQAKTQLSQYQRYEKGRESGLQLLALLVDMQRYVPAQIWFTRLSLQSDQLELEGTALTPEAIAVFIERFSKVDSAAGLHLLKMADSGQGQQSFCCKGSGKATIHRDVHMKINSGALEPLICWLCMLSPRRFYFVLLAACLICLIGGRLGLTALAQWMESSTWTAKNGAEMHQERMVKDVLSQRTLLLKISVDTLLLKPLATQCTDLPVGERFAQQINWQKDKIRRNRIVGDGK